MIVIFGRKWSIALSAFIMLVGVCEPAIAWFRRFPMGAKEWFHVSFVFAFGLLLLIINLRRTEP